MLTRSAVAVWLVVVGQFFQVLSVGTLAGRSAAMSEPGRFVVQDFDGCPRPS